MSNLLNQKQQIELRNIFPHGDARNGVVTGWRRYFDGGATPTNGIGTDENPGTGNFLLKTDHTSPLSDFNEFQIKKLDATDYTGYGFSCDFTVDEYLTNTDLRISFHCNYDTGFPVEEMDVYVYNIDSDTLTFIDTVGPLTNDFFRGKYTTDSSRNYRLIFHYKSDTVELFTLRIAHIDICHYLSIRGDAQIGLPQGGMYYTINIAEEQTVLRPNSTGIYHNLTIPPSQTWGNEGNFYVSNLVVQGELLNRGDIYAIPPLDRFNKQELDNGSELEPTLYFSTDTDTGIFRESRNSLGITAGGLTTAYFKEGLTFLPWTYYNTTGDTANVVIGSDGQLYATSCSLRTKTVKARPDIPLDLIDKLQIAEWELKDSKETTRRWSLIADEVAIADSHLAEYNDGMPENLQDRAITAVLVEVVKKLKQKVLDLESRL